MRNSPRFTKILIIARVSTGVRSGATCCSWWSAGGPSVYTSGSGLGGARQRRSAWCWPRCSSCSTSTSSSRASATGCRAAVRLDRRVRARRDAGVAVPGDPAPPGDPPEQPLTPAAPWGAELTGARRGSGTAPRAVRACHGSGPGRADPGPRWALSRGPGAPRGEKDCTDGAARHRRHRILRARLLGGLGHRGRAPAPARTWTPSRAPEHAGRAPPGTGGRRRGAAPARRPRRLPAVPTSSPVRYGETPGEHTQPSNQDRDESEVSLLSRGDRGGAARPGDLPRACSC